MSGRTGPSDHAPDAGHGEGRGLSTTRNRHLTPTAPGLAIMVIARLTGRHPNQAQRNQQGAVSTHVRDITRKRRPAPGSAARWFLALLLLATALGYYSPASGSPKTILNDYLRDGALDHAYPVVDLRRALALARRRGAIAPEYSAFADAVNQAITDDLVGSGAAAQEQLNTPRSRTEIAPPPQPEPVPIPSNLPTPPQGSPADSIPWVVPTMAIIAGILILAGIGSSVWRRVRR